MRKVWISYEGTVINAGNIIEKLRDTIKEKMGVDVDEMGEYEALFAAAQVTNKSVPELLGI